MMKKKTKTYVLLGVVVLIWGIIGYKIISSLNPSLPEQQLAQTSQGDFKPSKKIEADTFSIELTERDPFLGTMYRPKTTSKPKRISKPKEEIVWPNISYLGTVKKSSNSKNQIFVITIDGQQYLLKKGQEVKEVKLLSGSENEVKLQFKKKRKEYTKQ